MFEQITNIHVAADYTELIEWYIRIYKLKDYDIEADEVNKNLKVLSLRWVGCKRFGDKRAQDHYIGDVPF